MKAEIFSAEKCSLLLELSHAFSALLTLEELLPSIIAHTKEVLRAELRHPPAGRRSAGALFPGQQRPQPHDRGALSRGPLPSQ